MGTNITGIGNANAIGFKSRVTGGAYFPPELKDALVGVWSAYGKSNDSTDRNIIKNKIKDRGGDFIISNAAFKLNSGFGGFVEDFTSWDRIDSSTAEISNDGSKIKCINTTLNVQYLFNSINRDIPSFKVKISNFTKGDITYYYRKEDGIEAFLKINPLSVVNSDKVIELPKSYNTVENGTGGRGGFYSSNINIGVTITQIPSFEGAFVTDGVNDLITSTKTVQEMLRGSSEYTVLSMIHHIDVPEGNIHLNTVRIKLGSWGTSNRITSFSNNKTGIYGYTVKNQNITVINNILGDKNDYGIRGGDYTSNLEAKFSVVGWIGEDDILRETASIAWYWTIIANKVLTTDQINQVIAYFNLDRTLKPDILCDVKKQGITNDNHAEFGDKLIDFSGNGRDIQLNNIAWDGDSGIGKYNYPNWKVTATIANTYSTIVNYPTVNGTYSINVNGVSELMQSIGLHLEIKYTTSTGIIYNDIKQDGVYSYILPDGATNLTLRFGGIPGIVNEPCNITITQIPSHAGGLCLDGINDFGKVTGMPIYKDYTIVADYERLKIGYIEDKGTPAILSKSYTAGQGAFLMNLIGSTGERMNAYTFGNANSAIFNDLNKKIYYQSKYKMQGVDMTIGSGVDGDSLWLGVVRDNDSRFFNGVIYSLMSFPYSMSEFLIERQLKKHKLGTLYPNMVEFRPVIKSSVELASKPTFAIRGTSTLLNAGDYVPENSQIWVSIKMNNIADRITKFTVNGKTIDIPKNAYSEVTLQYGFPFVIDKSPQKITMTIEQDENYVQWNPVVESTAEYSGIGYLNYSHNLATINVGDYISIGDIVAIRVILDNTVDEIVNCKVNGQECEIVNVSPRVFDCKFTLTSESPQNINITIDEYIRYEDIVQPYPVLLRFNDENGNEVSWGGKFKVGSTITRIGSAADSNLLPNIYNIFGLLLNGNQVTSSKVIVEKTMVFKAKSAYIFDNNEPKCILSPRLLRIPNSSYKILGHIPDISGHGNHGKINNSAYAEGSGVNEDGSYQFDGVDDFVTIPTLSSGGKQVLMKVNLPRLNEIIYDQRKETNTYTFAIITIPSQIAYDQRNSERITYIDGILNTNIIAEQLMGVTHNIVVINSKANLDNTRSPILGRDINGNNWSRMRIYDFMLFESISTDDKIKELNEYVGIEGNVFEFNPTFTIDLPMAIKSIKVYQGGNEISPGYLYPNKDTEFEVYVSLNDGKYAVGTITVDGVEITKDRVVGEYNIFKFTLNGSSEQKITIHSYEYIMYEDIIQPYPSFVKLENLDRTHTYTWGDKLRIGDTIRYNSSKNLLEGAYTLRGQLECNGVYVFDNNQQIVVTKEMVFAWSHSPVWTIGNSAPKCVFSPSKLRIPNSSYKYLGYIPDISGNGNNGAFTNFAFSGMSGADGYLFDFYTVISLVRKVSVTDDTIVVSRDSTSDQTWALNLLKQSGQFDLYVNWEDNSTRLLVWAKGGTIVSQYALSKGWNSIPAVLEDYDYIYLSYVSPSVLGQTVIKQKAKYEGSICFDGIDDYVDIPSLSIGGKQVLMKTNWLKSPTLLYDQKASGSFAILTTKEDDATNPRIAYQARNQDGKTYIDGIENNYIETYSLKGITHNITVTNPSAGSGVVPVIGANTGKSSSFAKMALYDFMLFDEVSTNEEIKQLNDIVGIEGGYVQKPPYYWDAYGKTNSDADRDTIQQRGIAVGDYDLTNTNFAYDKMSGYGGYSLGRFDKSWASSSSNNTSVIVVSRNPYDITLKKLGGNSDWEFNNTELKVISNPVSVKFKSNKNIRVTCDYHYYPVGGNSEGTPLGITSKDLIANKDAIITISSISQENIDKYNIDINRGYYLIYFQLSPTLAVNEEVTIEMLPLYPNGLVYDGVDDYSENISIPAFTDYTYIFKRTLLNKKYNSASVFKGSNQQSGGGAFICDYNSVEPELMIQGYSFGAGLYANSLNTNDIVYGTKNSVNGQTITSGNNADTEGLTIGKWRAYKQMVFYKLMLYPRTTDMLTINMIKNMMAEDGIIDIQGKLFTDKYTGDFNLDFNKDFLIGN